MPYPREGSHITVFIDRIEQMRAPSNVLAHVMVHEITHLLQGIGRHSATGVMKGVWTAGDFGGMRLRPLFLHALGQRSDLLCFGGGPHAQKRRK